MEYIQEAALSEAYCSMDEFEELDYYLFCDSQLHEGAGGFTFKPCIIGGETETIEEAKQLYQKFIEKLPLDSGKKGEENNAFYISPDCKWVIMNKWNEHKTISTQMLFYEKEKVREKETEARNEIYPILIVKDGDNYSEMSEKCYEKLIEMKKIFFYDGRSSFFRIEYPSGEVTYLGEYMYSACFSPDGKYVAYSSDVDYDDGVEMESEERERMERICPTGICVREIETGKTAYIYWDPAKNPEENYMEYRHFMWIEKEEFKEYMGGS